MDRGKRQIITHGSRPDSIMESEIRAEAYDTYEPLSMETDQASTSGCDTWAVRSESTESGR